MATTAAIAGAAEAIRDDKKSRAEEAGVVEPKEFFWDQFITYISTGILALTVLNVSVEFLRGGGVTCFPPTLAKYLANVDEDEVDYEISRSQSDYFNNFCSHSIPTTEYFPIFLLAQGILLVTPHFVWRGLFKGDFDSFFAVSEKLDRLRERNTGDYDPKNFDRVEKLELEFGGKRKQIFHWYIFKHVLQLAICIGSVVVSWRLFFNFSFNFHCPMEFSHNQIPQGWPLNLTIPCVYTSLRVLGLVRYADYILIGIALVLVLIGLGWCVIRHTKELGHEEIAKFVFESCLPPQNYVFPKFYKIQTQMNKDMCWHCSFPLSLILSRHKGCIWCSSHVMLFTPRIQNDLDFLLLRLFRADPSHGRVFKGIQVEKNLRLLRGNDHELLHLFMDVKLDIRNSRGGQLEEDDSNQQFRRIDFRKVCRESGFRRNPEKLLKRKYNKLHGNIPWRPADGIRDCIYGFVQFAVPQEVLSSSDQITMAMDISFGSTGYALALARAFDNVISVNFHQFFRNETQPVKSEYFYTNYVNVHFPENIFTQTSETISDAVKNMVERIKRTDKWIDFLVIGPFTDANKIVKVTLTIELLYAGNNIEHGAILLAVRPLMIGHRKTSHIFCKYEPPRELFDYRYHEKKVLPVMKEEIGEENFVSVANHTNSTWAEGVVLNCGGTRCVFEFITYKYTAEPQTQPSPPPGTFTEINKTPFGRFSQPLEIRGTIEPSLELYLPRHNDSH